MLTEGELKAKIEEIRLQYLEYMNKLQDLKKKQTQVLGDFQDQNDAKKAEDIIKTLSNK